MQDYKKYVVAIHGYADTAVMFDDLKKLLPKHEVIAINLPINDQVEKVFSLQELTQYCLNYISKLNIQKYTLIGFSLGGLIAIDMAYKNAQVENLYLLNTYPNLIANNKIVKTYKKIKPILTSKSTVKTMCKFNQKTFSQNGTLLNCLDEELISKYLDLNINKKIILFKDDKIVQHKLYLKNAHKNNLNLEFVNEGGHNSKEVYWENLIKSISF